ncbi:MAG: hydantoinase/carbamoylase family amidase [Bordetella sp.]|uniref:hydantoinase/carbamoylase family amidase n=1 Tax=Bordetella sp. TaxID=28081 RepID=UPI003F7CAC91
MQSDAPLWYGRQVMTWAAELAAWSDQKDNLTCTYLTPAHRATARQIGQWMQEAGFDTVRHDAVGNVIGRYKADASVAHPELVVTGSHYDTVRNGGRYDGRLGILLPMAVVAQLSRSGERLPYDFDVVAFAEEEGARYGTAFLASSAYIGRYDPAWLDLVDANGVALRQAMIEAGLVPAAVGSAAVDTTRIKHYFEAHIEQGPVLLDAGLALGVVTSIAGSMRRKLLLKGRAGHAGTTPMSMRRDAACAAAEIALYVEQRCSEAETLVGTVGLLEVPSASVNVIPGACRMSLDIRAADDATRDAAVADVERKIEEICARRNIAIEDMQPAWSVAAAPCSGEHRAMWRAVLAELGQPQFELPSGAGHDAKILEDVAPVSMLFVRCGNGGISHNPLETITTDDADLAGRAVLAFLRRLG